MTALYRGTDYFPLLQRENAPNFSQNWRAGLSPLKALLHRWRDEAVRAGRTITRIALAFEAADPVKSFGWGIAALHRLKCSDEVATSSPPAP